MHIKKPRLWSPSTRSNFEMAMPSSALFIECGGSRSSTPCTRSNVEMAVPSSAQFIECVGSRSSTPCTRSNVEMAVPSSAQFIECGGSRSSTPCTTQLETIPPKKRHILTDIEIDDILNFGSESEDEAFPIFVPRTERMFFMNDDAEDEVVMSQSSGILLDLSASRGGMPTGNANILYSMPAGPERFLFDWKAFPETPIPPRDRSEIFREAGGPVLNLPGQFVQSPEAIFLFIWDSAIIGHIVAETNRYAEEEISERQDTLGTQSRLHRWTPTNVDLTCIFILGYFWQWDSV
ncbi:unnamed protein product [Parnassius apollo]|uniref:(apollo) hypothetical protein n=1 Tax=Parnassius apollo TaxID=110799 RepID=A0A8S3XYJ9_PARAO|nr:unnamed protein product [Parnassius apollo]